MTGRRALAIGIAAAALTAACGDDGPDDAAPDPTVSVTTIETATTEAPTTTTVRTTTTTLHTTTTSSSSTITAPTTAAPATTTVPVDPTAPSPPLTNAEGANEASSGVAQLVGFGSNCTAFLVDLGPPDAPAHALTNGHCVGIFDATTVLVEFPATEAVLRFRLFADTPDAVVDVPVTAIAYGSMRATDVAVLELGATRADLQGLAAYMPGSPRATGDAVSVVGVPSAGIAPEEWFLRGGTCTAGSTGRLVEWEWLWDSAISADCAGIVGGSSGSPMFAADDPTVAIGIVNTTTIGAGPGGSCYLGQPCEITVDGAVEVAGRTYAMPLAAWAACWAPTFDIANADCPAEQPPVVTVDAPLRAVPPGATWVATIGNGGPDRDTLVKVGSASTTDCRDPAGYGEPARGPDPRPYDAALPSNEGVYVLCAARADPDGAPSTADAGYAVMQVDATPPDAPIVLATTADPSSVRVEPIFAPPEYSSFLLRYGPAGTIDCADLDGYGIYLRVPIVIDATELPATLCVIGEDEAGNRGAPQSFPLP